ncbi:MAG TPA: hypothetical protein PLC26_05095 [Bacillota bacterium]|nr:hypothetical protein [Bacillota bacterium]HQD39893.1 hypothetical protein [Bacillota bacterium]
MRKICVMLLVVVLSLLLVVPSSLAITRTFQIEPHSFLFRKINLQYEWMTRPQRSLMADGALVWDNNVGKPIYLAAGFGMRRYFVENFEGPWGGGKVQFITDETGSGNGNPDVPFLRTSLLGGFKWVSWRGFTHEVFVGTRIEQPLAETNTPTQILPVYGYSIGFSF